MDTITPMHPGAYLRTVLLARGMSQREFARRMSTTPKHVSEVIRGESGFSDQFAVKMERVLGGEPTATFWLALQANYRTTLLKRKATAV